MYVLDILSTAYHHRSQGSLSTRFRHGRGVKTANYGSTRVKHDLRTFAAYFASCDVSELRSAEEGVAWCALPHVTAAALPLTRSWESYVHDDTTQKLRAVANGA